MARQLLFYENVTPISKERHGRWSVQQEGDYGHAAELNSCPLMVSEFHAAGVDLPVVFGKAGEAFAPVVILGIEPGRSLMTAGDGSWTGRYVPAFIRRYPFVFAQGRDGETLTLCLDETFRGCDPEGGRGQRLFDDAGNATPFLERALEFARNVEVEHRRTQVFCALMDRHGLFDPMNAEVIRPGGQRHALTNFFMVSKARLKELGDEVVMEFFRRDALELIYAHLASVANLDRLRERLG